MINDYCKRYREHHMVKLSELCIGVKVGTISAFECGRSSNIVHLQMYANLSFRLQDSDNFFNGLKEVMKNG